MSNNGVYLFTLFSIVMILICSGCSKSNNGSNNQCNFGTDSALATAGSTVVYSALGKGSASIFSLSYRDSTGTVNVSSPTLPWYMTVHLRSGGQVYLSANGTAGSGSTLTLAWGVSYSSNNLQVDTVSCGH